MNQTSCSIRRWTLLPNEIASCPWPNPLKHCQPWVGDGEARKKKTRKKKRGGRRKSKRKCGGRVEDEGKKKRKRTHGRRGKIEDEGDWGGEIKGRHVPVLIPSTGTRPINDIFFCVMPWLNSSCQVIGVFMPVRPTDGCRESFTVLRDKMNKPSYPLWQSWGRNCYTPTR